MFTDATDGIHADSLKLEYVKDQGLKNSADTGEKHGSHDHKDFVPTNYSKVCSDKFVESKTNNLCAYNFDSLFNVYQVKSGEICLIRYLFNKVNIQNQSQLI